MLAPSLPPHCSFPHSTARAAAGGVCVRLVRRSQAMSRVEFHFHAELNDFLAPVRRGAAVIYRFGGRVSIKDAIESLGVPHTEIEAIVVGSTAVDFAYIVRDS